METEEDVDVDVIGDFDLVDNLAHLNKFKDERKLKKEKRIGFKRNRCYSVFEPSEQVVKISKFDGDVNEDVEIDVEDDGDNDEFVQAVQPEQSPKRNKRRTEKRKTRNGHSESENSSNELTNLPLSELHYLILRATGLGDGAITLSYNDNGQISKLVIYKTFKTYHETFNYSTERYYKNIKLEESKEKRMYCKHFDTTNLAPFRIKFRLESLIIAECHAHGAEQVANAGLFRGFYDKEEHALHITDTIPIGVVGGDIKYDRFNEETIVGWYFAFPLATTDSYVINVPLHNDLKKLFTNNELDPFIMMAISPFNRIKTRCVITVNDSPYLIDYEVYFYEEMTLEKAISAVYHGLCQSNRYTASLIHSTSNFNEKTYGQLCYESIRRLLDSTTNRVCNDIKDKLMMKAQEVLGYKQACRETDSSCSGEEIDNTLYFL